MDGLLARVVTLGALVACTGRGAGATWSDDPGLPATADPVAVSPALQPLADCDAYAAHLVDALVERLVVAWSSAPASWIGTEEPLVDLRRDADHADLVHTDGAHLFVAEPFRVVAAEAPPRVVASLDFVAMPTALALHGTTLVLVAPYVADVAAETGLEPYAWVGEGPNEWAQRSRLTAIDVADPARPTVVRVVDLEGDLLATFRDGDRLHVVLRTDPVVPRGIEELLDDRALWPVARDDALPDAWRDARDVARERLRPRVEEMVGWMDPNDLLPRVEDRVPGDPRPERALLACDDVLVPDGFAEGGLVSVATLDLRHAPRVGVGVSSVGLAARDALPAASPGTLLLAQRDPAWRAEAGGPARVSTLVHRLSLGTEVRYEGSGSVDGEVRGAGGLGVGAAGTDVVTHDAAPAWVAADPVLANRLDAHPEEGTPATNAYVLADGTGVLAIAGETRGIAPGEPVSGVAVLGDVAWVGTLRDGDDAVHVVDLAAGALGGRYDLPGYAGAFLPLGGGGVLALGGVGADPHEDPHVAAAHLLDPTGAVATWTGPPDMLSYLSALNDRGAVSVTDGRVGLPLAASRPYAGWESWLQVLAVGDGTLEDLGGVDHAELAVDSCPGTPCSAPGLARVEREVLVGDLSFTVSRYGVKVTRADDPAEVLGAVEFGPAVDE